MSRDIKSLMLKTFSNVGIVTLFFIIIIISFAYLILLFIEYHITLGGEYSIGGW